MGTERLKQRPSWDAKIADWENKRAKHNKEGLQGNQQFSSRIKIPTGGSEGTN